MMGPEQHGGLAELAEASADRAVLRAHSALDIVVEAQHARWRIGLTDDAFSGWVAVRVDATGESFGDTPGWLGEPDLSPDRVVNNMLQLRWLPGARQGWSIPIDATHPWHHLEDVRYARCPAGDTGGGCGLIGPMHLMRCVVDDFPKVDLDEPVEVRCRGCENRFDGRLQAAPSTGLAVCQRCAAASRVPALTPTMCCPECGTIQPAPNQRPAVEATLSSSLQRLAVRRPTVQPSPDRGALDPSNVLSLPQPSDHSLRR